MKVACDRLSYTHDVKRAAVSWNEQTNWRAHFNKYGGKCVAAQRPTHG